MHIRKAKITYVSANYQRTSKRTGKTAFCRDFDVQWHDDTSGYNCSLSFTLTDKLSIMPQLAVGKLITLDYILAVNEWNGRHFNNTRILGDPVISAIDFIDPPKEAKTTKFT